MCAAIILVVLSVLYVSNFQILCCRLIGYRKLIPLIPAFCYYMSINCAINDQISKI